MEPATLTNALRRIAEARPGALRMNNPHNRPYFGWFTVEGGEVAVLTDGTPRTIGRDGQPFPMLEWLLALARAERLCPVMTAIPHEGWRVEIGQAESHHGGEPLVLRFFDRVQAEHADPATALALALDAVLTKQTLTPARRAA